MRVIRTRSFAHHFQRSVSEPAPVDWALLRARGTVYNPFTMTMLLLGLFALTALAGRAGTVALVSSSVFLGALYLRARQTALGIHVRRTAPEVALENTQILSQLEMRNESPFQADSLICIEHFNGSRAFRHLISLESPLRPGETRKLDCLWTCDAGMGTHRFGPTSVMVSDPFGIFQFTMTELDTNAIEVHPKTIPLSNFGLPASLKSSGASLTESPSSGNSAIVLGVREYVKGDPITRIHWKLSAKHGSLIVKELENAVSTDLTLFIDMDQRNHIGLKDESTWEYAKDIAISLIQEALARNHPVQLSSQEVHIPFGRGLEHSQWMTETVSALRPKPGASADETLLRLDDAIPFGSSVIYIGPIYQNDDARLLSTFSLLRERAVSISAVFIEAPGFGRHARHDAAMTLLLNRKNSESEVILDRILHSCLHLEIPTYSLKNGQSVAESMANPRRVIP